MLRFFIFLLIILGISVGLVWIGDNSGNVTLQWLGYRIDTTVSFLLVVIVLLLFLFYVVIRVFQTIFSLPGAVKARREEHGSELLVQGFTALAAGDIDQARRISQRSGRLSGHSPLSLILAAQTAQIEGNEEAAISHFQAMTEEKSTEFLGLRGLLLQAIKQKDYKKALELADRADKIRPNTPWLIKTLIELSVRRGQLDNALESIDKAARKRIFNKAETNWLRAIVQYEKAKEALNAGNTESAIDLLITINKKEPEFIPATKKLARLLIDNGKKDQAAKYIEKAWKALPHPDLAKLYMSMVDDQSAEKQLKRLEKLTKQNPDHYQSNLLVARMALKAKQYSKARNHLKVAMKLYETREVCRLMAELEEAEHGEDGATAKWLERAAKAKIPAPAWSCNICGHRSETWQLFCESCGSFDAVRWKESPVLAVIPPHSSSFLNQ